MFVIHWVYALVNIVVALLLFFYIGKASPGLPKGDSNLLNFSFVFICIYEHFHFLLFVMDAAAFLFHLFYTYYVIF